MMESITTDQQIRFVPFKDLFLWDLKAYSSNALKPQAGYLKLSHILTEVRIPISHEQVRKDKLLIISKINFSGKLFLREEEAINYYKGRLFLVPKHNIIFSKINARYGCIYYNNSKPFVVSSEYPVFKIDSNKADGEYLHLALRTKKVKGHLTSKITGVSKPRLKQEEFVLLPIPIPPLSKQKALVSVYQRQVQLGERQKIEANKIEKRKRSLFFNQLGITTKQYKTKTSKSKLEVFRFKNVDRWSLTHLLKERNISFDNSKFERTEIKNLLLDFEGGKTPTTSRPEYWNGNINWVSPKDFNGLEINSSEDKITTYAVTNAGMKVFKPGVILGVFRSGILKHSFPVAITRISVSINQDLKAMEVNTTKVDKYFLLHYLDIMQKYVLEKCAKVGVTVESLNTDEFLDLPVVVPPMKNQIEIVKNLHRANSKINSLKSKAEQNISLAMIEFEKKIFNV